MNTDRRRAVAALTTAGLLWGTTVPLSKLALGWLPPGWLTFARFGLAAAILLVAGRRQLRGACTLPVLASGAAGYGGSVVIQNVGIGRTSVSHAALLIGATPVMVAVIAALWHRTVARPVAWAGFAVSLAGIGLVTSGGSGGGGATMGGDGLVLASLLASAAFTVGQGRLLRGRDPIAVTAVQFFGAALAVLPFSVATEGVPAAPGGLRTVLATAALAVGGTLLPFTLFAYAQSRVAAEVAGAFFNIEPLVGAVAGIVFFGNAVGLWQVTGGAAILAGIALSGLPLLAAGRPQAQQHQRQEGARQQPAPGRPQTTAAVRRHALAPEPAPRRAGGRGHPCVRRAGARTAERTTAASTARIAYLAPGGPARPAAGPGRIRGSSAAGPRRSCPAAIVGPPQRRALHATPANNAARPVTCQDGPGRAQAGRYVNPRTPVP
jgi:O-acetylserine/cysteine efflux transporter